MAELITNITELQLCFWGQETNPKNSIFSRLEIQTSRNNNNNNHSYHLKKKKKLFS